LCKLVVSILLFGSPKVLKDLPEGAGIVGIRLQHPDDGLRADFKCLERVASLQDDRQAALYLPETLCHPSIPNWRHGNATEWVSFRRIEASGYYDHIWCKLSYYWEEECLTCEDVVAIADGLCLVLLICGSTCFLLWEIERKLEVVALACSFTDHFQLAFGSWEERAEVEPVDGDVEDRVVVVEDIAGAIADVHVPVKDADLALAELFLGHLGRDSHVVEEAEASHSRAVSVMAWRSHDGEH